MSTHIYQRLIMAVCLCTSVSVYAQVKEYHLTIDEKTVNLTGKAVKKITVNGQFPAPALEFEEGDDAVIHVHNNLKNQDTSVHWHGLLLPGLMDGVPGFNQFNGIKPDADFVYKFKVRQNGTYWYHAHSKGQEQDGLYGSLIIYPKDKKALAEHEKTNKEYVVMLSDFHESSSAAIFANLKKSSEYYQNQRETAGDVFNQIKRTGFKNTLNDRSMWNQMRMLKTDLSDVTGYTFLVNGKTPEQNWTANFASQDKVRLRFINASAMSFFDVRIPNLKMTVVSADGQPVKPVPVDEFRIGSAETYDVVVEPKNDHYQIQAESIDRSGFALASLQNIRAEKPTEIQEPKARPRALLSMEDMGHGSMEMDHSNLQHENHDAMNMTNQDSNEMDHQSHEQHEVIEQSVPVGGWANASTPKGLKALQYSDLKALTPQKDLREPEQELVIRLGGSMERYIWTINGKKFNEVEPLNVKYGERIRLKFVNESMMAHPMHLHGMFMQLENGQSQKDMPNKHTVVVPPGKTVTALLTADELGEWAIHCHLLYHMSAGMMSKLVVANVDEHENLENNKKNLNQDNNTAKEGGHHEHH